MKIEVMEMIRRPEPSADPVKALYVALIAAACLAAATALFLQAVSHA